MASKGGFLMKIDRLTLFSLLCSIAFVAGCSLNQKVPQWSGSGFIRKGFLEYKRVAILPFNGDPTGEVSDAFALRFQDRFPQIATVDRRQLLKAFQNQDLYTDRFDEAKRAKLRETFGVDAVVMGDVYYPSIVRWLLQVKVVDVKTDVVMGRSLVEIDFMGAEGMEQACNLAVQMLTLK
jgi:hypothetical protein